MRWLRELALTGAGALGATLAGGSTGCAAMVTPIGDASPDQVRTDAVLVDTVVSMDVRCTPQMNCNGAPSTCSVVQGCEGFQCTQLFCSCVGGGCSCSCPGGPLAPPELAT